MAKDKLSAKKIAWERRIAVEFNTHEISRELGFDVERQETVPSGRLDLFIKGSDLRRQSQKPQIYNIIVELKLLKEKKLKLPLLLN